MSLTSIQEDPVSPILIPEVLGSISPNNHTGKLVNANKNLALKNYLRELSGRINKLEEEMRSHKNEFDAYKVNNSLQNASDKNQNVSVTKMHRVKESELKIPQRPISMFTDGDQRQGQVIPKSQIQPVNRESKTVMRSPGDSSGIIN